MNWYGLDVVLELNSAFVVKAYNQVDYSLPERKTPEINSPVKY